MTGMGMLRIRVRERDAFVNAFRPTGLALRACSSLLLRLLVPLSLCLSVFLSLSFLLKIVGSKAGFISVDWSKGVRSL